MKRIHQKSQNTEKRKIQFFSQILTEFVDVVASKEMAGFYTAARLELFCFSVKKTMN